MWNIEKYREELEAIVNIDSGSEDMEGIRRVAEILSGRLKNDGFFVEIFDEGTRVQAKSHDEEDFDVLMVGHMDTVFPEGTAAERPYTEADGLAHGPGVADMKAGLLLAVTLAEKLRETRPDLRLCLAFNSDEEIGSARSIDWFCQLAEHGKYAFVFEPGRDGKGFVRSRKGGADLVARFKGIAAHAGVAPEKGANAIVEMARWITALAALQDLAAGTSVTAGVVSGGTASNVVAEHGELKVDIRFRNPEELDRIKAAAAQLADTISVAGVQVQWEFLNEIPPMNPTQVTEALMEKLDAAASELGYEISWVDTGGVSDANHLAGTGLATICGCGPCGGNLHSSEEFMVLESIEERLNLMYRLLSSL